MNLKPRFLLLTCLLVIASAAAAWYVSRQLAENIVAHWAVRYAEMQVLYYKSRLLQPLLREIALSRQLANSKAIIRWMRQPDDPDLTRQAIAEMENFRENFADHSYFVAHLASGRYYHNNARNEFAGKQFRYTLSPDKAQDRWFYDIVKQRRDIHINVNPDVNLGVTKLWIDVLVRDGDTILGAAGTGLELTEFIQTSVDQAQPGITSLFVDHNGAIQAHRDEQLIDYASITKAAKEQKTLDLLFDRQSDRDMLYASMKQLPRLNDKVITHAMEIDGKRYLAGVAYLPELDWYEITLFDLAALVPVSSFTGIFLVYGITLLVALMLFNIVLNRQVLRPLKKLDNAMRATGDGRQLDAASTGERKGEVASLINHFHRLARAQWDARVELEQKVIERTEALERLTKTDPLTELLNRRGMDERLAAEVHRARRADSRIGLLLLDIDLFKEINDLHGHTKGDEALKVVAAVILATLRPYDSIARWGGDEFLVLTPASDARYLATLGERIRAAVAGSRELVDDNGASIPMTVSVGGYFVAPDDDMAIMLSRADKALYLAKEAGRDCYRAYGGDA